MKGIVGTIIALLVGSFTFWFITGGYYGDKVVRRTEEIGSGNVYYTYSYYGSSVKLYYGDTFENDYIDLECVIYRRGTDEFDEYTGGDTSRYTIPEIVDYLRTIVGAIVVERPDVQFLVYEDYYRRYISVRNIFKEVNRFPDLTNFFDLQDYRDLIQDIGKNLTDGVNWVDVFNILTGGSYYIAWFVISFVKTIYQTVRTGLSAARQTIDWLANLNLSLDNIIYTTNVPYKTILLP